MSDSDNRIRWGETGFNSRGSQLGKMLSKPCIRRRYAVLVAKHIVPPQLQDILTELYSFDNGKYTFYISPLEKIVYSSHFGDSSGKCQG